MRIVGGRHRGRALLAPADKAIRPTGERAREGLFNRLAHGGFGKGGLSVLTDAVVLDVFCGTGALGLEALSRGAARAIFLDSASAAIDCARRNAAALGETARCTFLRADARHPPSAPGAATIAFLDPPYADGPFDPAIAALGAAGWLAPGALLCLEREAKGADFAPPPLCTAIDARRYGRALSAILRWNGPA